MTTHRFILYTTVFFCGAVVLLVEILGTRLIGPFFGSTIYTWASLISTALTFLSIGYYLGGRLADRRPEPALLFEIVLGAGIAVSLIVRFDQAVLVMCDGLGLKWGPLLASFFLFSIPLSLLGMVGPFVIRLLSVNSNSVGSISGRVFCVSTFGSLLGALASGFFLLPLISLSSIFTGSGLLLIILATVGLGFEQIQKKRNPATDVLLIVLAMGISLFFPKLYHLTKERKFFEIMDHRQSAYGDLKVFQFGREPVRCLVLNGDLQSCITIFKGEPGLSYVQELARITLEHKNHLASTAKRLEDFQVLSIGLGAGSLIWELQNHVPLDIVEIDPEVRNLALEYFDSNFHREQNIIIDDGRRFLRKAKKKYDVICFTAIAGSKTPFHLASKEFFELLKDRVKPNGIVLYLLDAQQLGENLYTASLVKTARSVFPHFRFTSPLRPGDDTNAEMIMHLTLDGHFQSDLTHTIYDEVEINDSAGQLIEDERNNLDWLELHTQVLRRKYVRSVSPGYRLQFSN